MWMLEIPPFVPFFIGAVIILLTRGIVRSAIMVAIPVVSAIHLWMVPDGTSLQVAFLDYQLIPYRVDKLSLMFGYVFHIAAFIGIIYALHIRDTLQQVAAMLYAGSGLGAVFAGDLLTLFIFWEFLAFTSVFLIWARRTERSYASGMRYLVIQVLSGVILLAGALFYAAENGTLEFGHIGLDGIAGWLIFMAFGIKCAFPLVHNWLTDAYPEATVTGTVFLSAFSTKVAVYALARGYPGTELLVYIGATMAFFPIFLALMENNLRRVLSYSLIIQVGFMVVGIGIGTALALNGAVAHAFTHIIYKGLLFMSMGAVLHMTGRINGTDLGGLYKTMPKTTILCLVGAASISAIPLFSGFISKSMVMSAALANGFDGVWLILLFSSACVVLYVGMKVPYFAFFARSSEVHASDPPANMLIAMMIAAGLCIAIGVYPSALYSLLPYDAGYNPYSATHVLAQAQLLFFSALAFVWLHFKGLYPPALRSVVLDAEWLYRRMFPAAIRNLFLVADKADNGLRRDFLVRMETGLNNLSQRHQRLSGLLSHGHPVGSMVMWVAVILAAYLFLSFFR